MERSQRKRNYHLVKALAGLGGMMLVGYIESIVPEEVRNYCDYSFFLTGACTYYQIMKFSGSDTNAEQSRNILEERSIIS